MKNYILSNEEIKEGDYCLNTDSDKNTPRKVIRNEYGYLGVKLEGWFSWTPIFRKHKKVIFKTNP